MRRLRIAWILTPVKASIGIVSVLSGAFVEYIAACRIGYRRPEGMRWLSGVAGNYRMDRRLVLINRFGHIGNVYPLDVLLTRVDSEYRISTVTSILKPLLLDGSLLSPMLTQADTCLPGIVVGYLVFRFHQYTCLTTTHPPQLSRRSRRSSLFGPPIRNTSCHRVGTERLRLFAHAKTSVTTITPARAKNFVWVPSVP
jgi:hypothetical protein